MALEVGDAASDTGLAGAIKLSMSAAYGAPQNAEAEANANKFADALAAGIVPYLKNNADVIITDSDGGLQKSTAPGVITDAPDSPVTISGALD